MTVKYKHPQYQLRMPAELKEKLAGVAKLNNRSLNLEIVARLESSFLQEGVIAGLETEVSLLHSQMAEFNVQLLADSTKELADQSQRDRDLMEIRNMLQTLADKIDSR